MPLYDYFCAANGRTVEVRHGSGERLTRWADVCELAGIPPGDTTGEAPVERLVGAAVPLHGRRRSTAGPPPCGPSCACAE